MTTSQQCPHHDTHAVHDRRNENHVSMMMMTTTMTTTTTTMVYGIATAQGSVHHPDVPSSSSSSSSSTWCDVHTRTTNAIPSNITLSLLSLSAAPQCERNQATIMDELPQQQQAPSQLS